MYQSKQTIYLAWQVLIRSLLPPLPAFVAIICFGIPTLALASYQVDISAPQALRDTFTKYLDVVRYKDRDNLSEDQFRFLMATLDDQVRQLASTEGYFSATTNVRVEERGSQRIVHVVVDPKVRTIIGQVSLDVQGAVATETPPRIDQLRSDWPLAAGKPFRQEEWDKAKARGLQALQRRCYASARIADSQAQIDPENHVANLHVRYDSGPCFTLGALQVTGTKRYPESIVHNVNPLVQGEPYSVERLLELQRQIQGTSYFSNVIVDIKDDPAHALMAPVIVQVTEFPAQRVSLGGGYASDTGAHVNGRYANYDVFGLGWVFNGQAIIEQRRQFSSLDLAMPPEPGNYVNDVYSSIERTTLDGVDLRSLRAGLKRSHTQENETFAITLDVYHDDLQPIEGEVETTLPVTGVGIHKALVPGLSWSWRSVDDPLFPRDGDTLSMQAGFALKGILTDQSFTRFYSRLQHYLPVGERDLVLLHGEAGAVFTKGSNDDVPASLLFRAGGTESIRGYSYQSIGNLQDGTVFPTKFLMTTGAEYQHWFSGQWGGALFYDVGTATDNWSDRVIYQGIGVGARWHSPVGPINVDLAYGERVEKVRLHLSLGVAF